jgi:trk system potassium uptake protein TrkH
MLNALRLRIKNMARWESNAVKLLGLIEIVLGIALLAPAVVALFHNEDPMVFIFPAPILLILGTVQYLLFKSGETIKPAGGLLMIFVAWWIVFAVSSIPFYLSGFSAVDSLFESVSGFTTTGTSLITDASASYSIFFWGAITQWAGGIAIVLIFMFLLPMMGIGGKSFVNNELAGSETYNFSMRIKTTVKNFISIYVLLSVLEAVLLMITGVGLFESVTMMFSTISTGGFMVAGGSMADYPFAAQFVVLVFMFLGGTNFYLHYRALNKRDFSAYRASQEFIWTVILFIIATVGLLVMLVMNTDDISAIDPGSTIWNTLFTVVSMGTTTGYMIVDQPVWPLATYVILWIVMLLGSMSGSTSGGIKIYRLLILWSYISNGIYKMFHPRSVMDVKMNGHVVNSDAVVSAVVVVVMFIAVVIFSIIFLLISEPGMTISESIGLSISAISNTGMNTGSVTIQEISSISKVFLTFMMWVGRLEVVIALLLFTRTFWSDLIMDLKGNRRSAKGRGG